MKRWLKSLSFAIILLLLSYLYLLSMNFESAEAYLESFISYENNLDNLNYSDETFNLNNLKIFLKNYSLNYNSLKFIHVAGSKGKGSTCTLISDYLSKVLPTNVGLFTSPHILTVKERFSVNSENIKSKLFVSIVEDLKEYIDSIGGIKACSLTYFDLLLVVAFDFFIRNSCEYVVLEVGLGGRLDSTNIIESPELAIISLIENEHSLILGDTLGEIIDEKLGILKSKHPVIVGIQNEEGNFLIRQKLNSRLNVFYVDDFNFFECLDLTDSIIENCKLSKKSLKDVELNCFSLDSARLTNAKLAYLSLYILFEYVDCVVFKNVLKNFNLSARFDIRKFASKTVIFDMAHTKSSIKNLLDSLLTLNVKNPIFLLGFLKDKDIESIFPLFKEFSVLCESKFVFTSSHFERGFNPKYLSDIFPLDSIFEYNSKLTYQKLLKNLSDDQVLIVSGSHFLVSEILSI